MSIKKVLKFGLRLVPGLGIFGVVAAYPSLAFADVLSDRLNAISSATDEVSLVSSISSFAIPLGVISLVGIMTVAGYNLITSQGNPDKLNEAREMIINGLLGFAVVALSIAILALLQNVLNLPI
ncbi:MAG: hypothetical protein Fur003_2650 [Candidatus Dojkabacteria bacterium]